MAKQTATLVWMRNDLRLQDHPALHTASTITKHVAPLAMIDPSDKLNDRQEMWYYTSAKSINIPIRKTSSEKTLVQAAKQCFSTHMVWPKGATPKQRSFDKKLSTACKQAGIEPVIAPNNYLLEPEEILSKSNTPFKRFSQFSQTALKELGKFELLPSVNRNTIVKLKGDQVQNKEEFEYWSAGEAHATKRVAGFLKKGLNHYNKTRDDYTIQGTSMLSPHIRFGEVSLPKLYNTLSARSGSGKNMFVSELLWREYSQYLLFHFPNLPKEPMDTKFNKYRWKASAAHLSAWKNGKTGYPVVDAAMRELKETGWMHNRLRMIVASFLAKHLGIDWRKGEAWFAEQLVDYDLANNVIGWQWSAGQGVDMAPFFRIFNPTIQSKKFDPKGLYIQDWVPELDSLSPRHIHEPWQSDEIPSNYPDPIVDHTEARNEALTNFKKL